MAIKTWTGKIFYQLELSKNLTAGRFYSAFRPTLTLSVFQRQIYFWISIFALIFLEAFLGASSWMFETSEVIALNQNDVLVGVDDLTVKTGEMGEVQIFVESSSTAIGAATLTLSYDGSMFDIEACSFIESNYQGVCNISEEGTIRVTGINIEGATDRSVLATLVIDPTAIGSSQIEIVEVGTLADSTGASLTPELKSGLIVITETQPPTPSPTPTGEPLPPLSTSTPFPPTITLDEFEFLPAIMSNS